MSNTNEAGKTATEIIDIIETCLLNAPVDFLGTGGDWRYAEKQERKWFKDWKAAISELKQQSSEKDIEKARKDETIKRLDIKLVDKEVEIAGLEKEIQRLRAALAGVVNKLTPVKTGICANCGGDYGIHRSSDSACPLNGMEISEAAIDRGLRQQWYDDKSFIDDGDPDTYTALNNSYHRFKTNRTIGNENL